MGILDLFRRKQDGKSAMDKKLAAMKCKMVNYVAEDFVQLCAAMEHSDEYVTRLKPVNYYALKDEYIEAAFYSDDNYDENYVIFRLIKNDKPVKASGVYPVSKDSLRKAFTRLGAVSF